jgi:tetratricopeptide (TPR) repeat protein
MRARFLLGVLTAAVIAAVSSFASAAEQVSISVDTSKGYARMIFGWPKAASAQATIADGILVVTFDRPFEFAPGVLNVPLDGYVSVIKQDQSGRTLRMSLSGKYRVHTSHAGSRVAIDLLPLTMAGDPDDIVDPAAKPPGPLLPVKVKMKIAVQEDRTRLVFEWGENVDYTASVADGTVKVKFAREGKIDVSRLNGIPPAFVKSATTSAGDLETLLEIKVDHDSAVTHFRDKTRIVFDVMAPSNDKDGKVQIVVPEEMLPPAPKAKPKDVAEAGPEPAHEDAPPEAKPEPAHQDPGAAAPAEDHADEPVLRPGSDAAGLAEAEHEAEHPAPVEPQPAAAEPEETAAADSHGEPATEPHGEPAHGPADDASMESPPFKLARTRDEITLTLPALSSAPAAMFRRGDRLIIAVKGLGAIDTAAIVKSNKDLILSADMKAVGAASVLTLRSARPLSITAGTLGGGWIATISPDPQEPPDPVALLRDARVVGPAKVRATLDRAALTIELADPLNGERLIAVLATGAPQGVIGARSYVEFAADATAQGLLVRPFIDELTVTPGEHDVIIGAPDGLTLSAGTVADYSGSREAVGDESRPAAMDFVAWSGKGDFLSNRGHLLNTIDPAGKNPEPGRLALARFYLAYDLGAEAIGVLQMVVADDETVTSDPSFRALRAVALIEMQRYVEAEAELATPGLAEDPTAQLWRGLAAAGQEKWGAARDFIAAGEDAIADFRPDWQARFRLAGARGAIETNAVDVAERMLNAVPANGIARSMTLEADLLRGVLAERLKQDAEALRLYAEVREGGYRPLAVRAALAEILLQEKTGAIKSAEAIAGLDRLRWQWRGDGVELGLLHKLGNLQIASGDYRNGLQTQRAAVLGFPHSDEARHIQSEMAVVFEDLFLRGKADTLPPVQALGLYYDFKELTPIGTMGDEMVRRLADRLIGVDLLEQAAELLQHQVDRRLDGVAKAQISAKLAAVYLMDRKPEKALATLRSSSQTRLPEDLAAQRRLLSARALSDLKQYDAALDAFEQDDTPEAQRLRADVLWAASRWTESAAAVELLIKGREKDPAPLDGQDRYDILRAAIAYTMADDAAGLKSLRDRFVTQMATAPEAAAFEIVTRAADPGAVAFRDMAKSIAGIDTLDAFLKGLGLGRPADGTASN